MSLYREQCIELLEQLRDSLPRTMPIGMRLELLKESLGPQLILNDLETATFVIAMKLWERQGCFNDLQGQDAALLDEMKRVTTNRLLQNSEDHMATAVMCLLLPWH